MNEHFNIIKGAVTFYIDTFIVLITYCYDYIHIGLVNENRFMTLEKVYNIEELIIAIKSIEQFRINQIIDMITSHKEVEIILGRKYDGVIIYKGTMEDLFYNVIEGKAYDDIDTNSLQFVSMEYARESELILNKTVDFNKLHYFEDCKLIDDVVAYSIEVNEEEVDRFTEYMDDLDCTYSYDIRGRLENIVGKEQTISLAELPFSMIEANSIKNCNLLDIEMARDCVWEEDAVTDCKIETLIIKDCKIYNEHKLFVRCSIERLIIQREIIPDNLFFECDIKSIEIPDNTREIGKNCFNDCNLVMVETNLVQRIGTGAFSNSRIGALISTPNLKILDNYAFENAVINLLEYDFNNLLHFGTGVFKGCSQELEVELSEKLAYMHEDVFVGTKLKRIVNKSKFDIDFSLCDRVEFIETSSNTVITNTAVKEIILNTDNLHESQIRGCKNLEMITVNSTGKLDIDIEFISESSLKKLIINAEDIEFKYNNMRVSQDVFLDNIAEKMEDEELIVIINDEKVNIEKSDEL